MTNERLPEQDRRIQSQRNRQIILRQRQNQSKHSKFWTTDNYITDTLQKRP